MIGFLNDGSSDAFAGRLEAFRQGLSELGYVEGQNIAIEFRWAEGRYDRLPVIAADLAHREVGVIAASATPSAMAAKGATSTIPIIFAIGGDPVKFGLVKSVARPDGNATGVNFFTTALGQKRLGLLHELVAKGAVIGFLVNPSNPNTTRSTEDAQAAAEQLGHKLVTVKASTVAEIDTAFATLVQANVGGLMRRREFIAIAGGAAAMWPVVSAAQQVPVIGFLGSSSPGAQVGLTGFRQGLKEAGYIERENIAIEFSGAEGDYTRLPALAANLVSRRVAVIVASGPPTARAAKAATSTIPIVFSSGDDPVRIGLVPSLNSPGGNVTGVYLAFSELSAKKLGLLHDLLPQATLIGALLNPNSPTAERQTKDLQAAAHNLGLQLQIANASSAAREIDAALSALAQKKVGAVLVGSDPSYMIQREQIINRTKRYAMPAIYELRQFVDAGGLVSYGTNISDGYRVVGLYVGRILKGEKPADLPVVQETEFELVINMKTAKSLGIDISGNVLSLADEVIE